MNFRQMPVSASIATNGSGKSTLLKMIAGCQSRSTLATALVNPGSKIVYLPQQPDLDENHTVLEQIFADSGEQWETKTKLILP